MKRKTKHNPPKKAKPNFIKLSKLQRNYLNEVRDRQVREFNEALETVYQELGLIEEITQSSRGTYILRQDYSGLDVNIRPPIKEKVEEPEKPEAQVILKEKEGSKDN